MAVDFFGFAFANLSKFIADAVIRSCISTFQRPLNLALCIPWNRLASAKIVSGQMLRSIRSFRPLGVFNICLAQEKIPSLGPLVTVFLFLPGVHISFRLQFGQSAFLARYERQGGRSRAFLRTFLAGQI